MRQGDTTTLTLSLTLPLSPTPTLTLTLSLTLTRHPISVKARLRRAAARTELGKVDEAIEDLEARSSRDTASRYIQVAPLARRGRGRE